MEIRKKISKEIIKKIPKETTEEEKEKIFLEKFSEEISKKFLEEISKKISENLFTFYLDIHEKTAGAHYGGNRALPQNLTYSLSHFQDAILARLSPNQQNEIEETNRFRFCDMVKGLFNLQNYENLSQQFRVCSYKIILRDALDLLLSKSPWQIGKQKLEKYFNPFSSLRVSFASFDPFQNNSEKEYENLINQLNNMTSYVFNEKLRFLVLEDNKTWSKHHEVAITNKLKQHSVVLCKDENEFITKFNTLLNQNDIQYIVAILDIRIGDRIVGTKIYPLMASTQPFLKTHKKVVIPLLISIIPPTQEVPYHIWKPRLILFDEDLTATLIKLYVSFYIHNHFPHLVREGSAICHNISIEYNASTTLIISWKWLNGKQAEVKRVVEGFAFEQEDDNKIRLKNVDQTERTSQLVERIRGSLLTALLQLFDVTIDVNEVRKKNRDALIKTVKQELINKGKDPSFGEEIVNELLRIVKRDKGDIVIDTKALADLILYLQTGKRKEIEILEQIQKLVGISINDITNIIQLAKGLCSNISKGEIEDIFKNILNTAKVNGSGAIIQIITWITEPNSQEQVCVQYTSQAKVNSPILNQISEFTKTYDNMQNWWKKLSNDPNCNMLVLKGKMDEEIQNQLDRIIQGISSRNMELWEFWKINHIIIDSQHRMKFMGSETNSVAFLIKEEGTQPFMAVVILNALDRCGAPESITNLIVKLKIVLWLMKITCEHKSSSIPFVSQKDIEFPKRSEYER